MSKIITDKCEITFAALKLVEQLYKDNEIPVYYADHSEMENGTHST